jgi:hypothetical protein
MMMVVALLGVVLARAVGTALPPAPQLTYAVYPEIFRSYSHIVLLDTRHLLAYRRIIPFMQLYPIQWIAPDRLLFSATTATQDSRLGMHIHEVGGEVTRLTIPRACNSFVAYGGVTFACGTNGDLTLAIYTLGCLASACETPLRQFEMPSAAVAAWIAPDGKRVGVWIGANPPRLRVIDVETGDQLYERAIIGLNFGSVAWSIDSQRIAAFSANARAPTVTVIDLNNGSTRDVSLADGSAVAIPRLLTWLPDNRTVAIVAPLEDVFGDDLRPPALLIDTQTGAQQSLPATFTSIQSMAWSPDGSEVAIFRAGGLLLRGFAPGAETQTPLILERGIALNLLWRPIEG